MKLKIIITLGLAVAGWISAEPRPNILFIQMEDMGQQLSAYGDATAYTAHLDTLAREGMVFRNACVTAATCASSRSSLFSGLYPHQNGIMGFRKEFGFYFREGLPTFVPMLKEAGYYTGITYKTGVEPSDMVPFDQNDLWRSNRLHPDDNQNEIKNAVDNFRYFLEHRPMDRPFYFQAQNSDTHSPWVGKKVDEHFSIDGFPGAEIYKPVDPARVKPLPHFGPDYKITPRVQQFMAGYYEAVQRVDWFVGQILGLLDEYGVADDTLVIFTADHGPSHLSRGKTTPYEFGLKVPFIVRWPGKSPEGVTSDALVSFVDLMPTFLDVAGLSVPDYLPGCTLKPVFSGDSRLGMRKYIFSAYVTHTAGYYLYWPNRTISDGRYKLIWNINGNGERNRESWLARADAERMSDCVDMRVRRSLESSGAFSLAYLAFARSMTPPAFELYDLENDPGEISNLAGQKDVAEIEKRLKDTLLGWCRNTVADPFVDPDYVAAFTKDYTAKVAFFDEHNGDKKLVAGMSNLNRWNGWRLDMSRWIPEWNPAGYGKDPSRDSSAAISRFSGDIGQNTR